MVPLKVIAAAFATLWIALLALAWLVASELGVTRLKRHPFALLVLAAALGSVPAAGVWKVSRPYTARVAAIVARRQSPPVALQSGCAIFPANNIWNVPIAGAPVDPSSRAYIDSIGRDVSLHADFSAIAGIPYTVAHGAPRAQVTFTSNGAESDRGPYFIPDDAPVEMASDAHLIVVDADACRLYELFGAHKAGAQNWTAGSGAIFDLRSNRLRPAGWTSADAAGLPVMPGLVRYDEVLAGRIPHALRFTAGATRRAYVWPARHRASDRNDAALPAMGQRFRLRSSFDENGFSAEMKVLIRALKEYGMMLADNGSSWFVTGAPDSRWSSSVLRELGRIHGGDFEAVQTAQMQVEPDSAEARAASPAR